MSAEQTVLADKWLEENRKRMLGGEPTEAEIRRASQPGFVSAASASLTRPSIPRPPAPEATRYPKGKKFAIVDEVALLIPKDERSGLGRALHGPIAWAPRRGQFVARWQNDLGFCYSEWSESERQIVGDCFRPTDWELRAQEAFEKEGGSGYGNNWLFLDVRSQEEIDHASMIAQFPHLSELVPAPAVAPYLFEPGNIIVSKKYSGMWHDRLERHLSGDWGSNGEHHTLDLEDPETVWTIGLQSIATRNSFSLDVGFGPIVSKFELSEDEQASLRPKGAVYLEDQRIWWGCPTVYAWIVSEHGRTHCWLST